MKGTTTQDRLWTGSFLRICLVNLFIFVNFHALLPTFPFFVTYLGGDAVTIGLATALFSIASIVSRPFVGWLIDTRRQREKVAHANPLRKQYYEKRDDSDKLKLDTVDED